MTRNYLLPSEVKNPDPRRMCWAKRSAKSKTAVYDATRTKHPSPTWRDIVVAAGLDPNCVGYRQLAPILRGRKSSPTNDNLRTNLDLDTAPNYTQYLPETENEPRSHRWLREGEWWQFENSNYAYMEVCGDNQRQLYHQSVIIRPTSEQLFVLRRQYPESKFATTFQHYEDLINFWQARYDWTVSNNLGTPDFPQLDEAKSNLDKVKVFYEVLYENPKSLTLCIPQGLAFWNQELWLEQNRDDNRVAIQDANTDSYQMTRSEFQMILTDMTGWIQWKQQQLLQYNMWRSRPFVAPTDL